MKICIKPSITAKGNNILQTVEENRETSIRDIERNTGIRKFAVEFILNKQKWNAHKFTACQEHRPLDYMRRR